MSFVKPTFDFMVDYILVLSHHEQVCLIKHTCLWRDKLVMLWTMNRQAKIFLHIHFGCPSYDMPKIGILLSKLSFWSKKMVLDIKLFIHTEKS